MLLKDIRHFNEYPGDFLPALCSENLHERRNGTERWQVGAIRKMSGGVSRQTKICHWFDEEGDAVR